MIELPDGVVPNMVRPALIDYGGIQRPPIAGELLRINRLGNRYRVAVGLPPIRNQDLGRVVVSRLIAAKTEGLRIEWQLVGIRQGSPGAPLVKGAGQAGSLLACDGFRPGYGVGEGFWASIVTGGRRFLFNIGAPAQASASGEMTLTLRPPLRKSPDDNDVIELQRPMIEGLVLGDELEWDYSLAHHVGIQFEIEETR